MGGASRKDIEAALKLKGFVQRLGDHRYYSLFVEGRETQIRTKISTGTKYEVYGEPLLYSMRLQLHLPSRRHLEDFINCPLRHEDYLDLLRVQGDIG